MMRYNQWGLIVLLVCCGDLCATDKAEQPRKRHKQKKYNVITDLFSTIGRLHKNIFTLDSLKIVVATLPIYLPTRALDLHVQKCFYDKEHHENINQYHKAHKKIARFGVTVPIVLFPLISLFSSNEDFRQTSKVYLIGVPFVMLGKNLIRTVKAECCLRPENEYFCRHKRSYGGFPSGHMAKATYTAVLYGLRFGKKFAIPLGAYALYLGGVFISCNRHYTSQIVAGAALGAIYAFAASKVVDTNLERNNSFSVNLEATPRGQTAINVTYRF